MANAATSADRHLPEALRERAVLSLQRVIAGFPDNARRRGQSYFESGRVESVEIDGSTLRAEVFGSEIYTTLWQYDDSVWFCECTCPVVYDCKHAYALALEILSAREAILSGTTELETAQPDAAYMEGYGRPTGRGGSTAFASDDDALHHLRDADLTSIRARAVSHLIEGGPWEHPNPSSELRSELEENDPDLRCHLLARSIAKRANGWVPPALERYHRSEELRQMEIQRRRARAADALLVWAGSDPGSPAQKIRLVLFVENPYGNRLILHCQARQTSPRLKDAPRTADQVRALFLKMQDGKIDFDPLQYEALGWILEVSEPNYAQSLQLSAAKMALIDRFAGSPILTWAEDIDPALAQRAGIAPGEPITPSPGPAKLVPVCTTRDGVTSLELRYRWNDGTERTTAECVRVETQDNPYRVDFSSFVIAGGSISPIVDEPPSSLVDDFAEIDSLPVDAKVRAPLLRALGPRYPHLSDTLRRHTRSYPVAPVVSLDLREDDWLQIRIFAAEESSQWTPGQPADDVVVFELHPDAAAWSRAVADLADAYEVIDGDVTHEPGADSDTKDPEAATTPEDIWAEAPSPEQVQPLEQWISEVGARSAADGRVGKRECRWSDADVGWWLHASRSSLTRLAEAWQALPRGARAFGNDAARRLLSRQQRAVASVRVTASGVDWFEVSADWQAEGLQLSEEDLATLRKAKDRFVRLPIGWVRREVTGEIDETASLIAQLGIEVGDEPRRLTLFELAGADPAALEALGDAGADTETLEAIDTMRTRIESFRGIPRIRKPRGFRGELRPYQRDGLDFLAYATDLGLGAVLADDMGLGKTVQTLAWLQLQHNREANIGPALVVCPASGTENWVREAQTFTPGLRVTTLDRGRERLMKMDHLDDYDLVVTNYALLRRDADRWHQQRIRALVLDEAQNVKNPDAAITKSVRSLDAGRRIALTGTPLENRLLDLWSIVECVTPGYLGNRASFSEKYDGLDVPPYRRSLLAAKLRPLLLRRTKSQVAPDLPDRIEESRYCEMTAGQRKLYLAELAKSRRLVADLSEDEQTMRRNKISILAALTRLRQICSHPALAGGKSALGSGKFDALFDLLEPLLAEGHKVLLFSQFVESLRLLRAELKGRKMGSHLLTGSTTKRGEVIRAFENDPDPCVFLISLKAGGTGLNLTAASYVVLFDPWWNPAVEAQAIDRTHRIGQDRTVIAYRLITRGTIEEKIRELQERKKSLADDILGEAGFARSLGRADLEYILDSSA